MEKLVSIITPCYNGADYIDAYAESLLKQTYCNCQLIFIDDGSKDNSKEKIFCYKSDFLEKGFSFEYYYQENSGQAVAMANGLSHLEGDYIIWPDVDDLLTTDSIQKKVSFLEEHKEYGIVRTDFMVVDEKEPAAVLEYGAQKYKEREKEDLFLDYLLSRNMWLQPGCYMVRTEAFIKANPDKYIYPSRAGQNWQIVLPVLYYFRCGYLDEPLYVYILHKGSHSDSSDSSYEDKIKKYEEYEKLLLKTIQHMRISDEKKYASLIKNCYARFKLDLAFEYRKKKDAEKFYKILNSKNKCIKDRIKMRFADSAILHVCILLLRNIRQILKNIRK